MFGSVLFYGFAISESFLNNLQDFSQKVLCNLALMVVHLQYNGYIPDYWRYNKKEKKNYTIILLNQSFLTH